MLDLATEAAQGLSDLIWLTLLHATWIGLAVGSISAVAAWLIPPAEHRARHLLLLAALALQFGGSLVGGVVQTGFRGHETAPRIQSAQSAVVRSPAPITLRITPTEPTESLPPSPSPRGETHADAGWINARAASAVQAMRPIAMAAWCLGAATFGLILLLGSSSLRRMRRESKQSEALDGRVRTFARLLRLRRVPEIRVHPRISEPCLAGIVRPVVLLPSAWLELATVAEVDAVLAHELSHAQRLDHLTYPAIRLVEACLFFHPCVHWLTRSARREAEHAADVLAARITGDPTALARALESVARLQSRRPTVHRVGLAIGGERSSLLPRIQELLGMTPRRPRPIVWPLAAFPAAVVFAGIAATARPVSNLDGLSAYAAERAPTPRRYFPLPKPFAPPAPLSREERRRLATTETSKLTAEDHDRLRSFRWVMYNVRSLTMTEAAWRKLPRDGFRELRTSHPDHAWAVETAMLNSRLQRIERPELFRDIKYFDGKHYEDAPLGNRAVHGGADVTETWVACPDFDNNRLTVSVPLRDGSFVDAIRLEHDLTFELERNQSAYWVKGELEMRPSARRIENRTDRGGSSRFEEATIGMLPFTFEGSLPIGTSLLLDTGVSVGSEPLDPAKLRDRLQDRRDFLIVTPTPTQGND